MGATAAQLRDLTGSPEKTDLELALFLQQGQLIVDEDLAPLGALSSQRLDSIALYLAGHYFVLSVEGGGITYARAGLSEERYKTYGGAAAVGFLATRFGEAAVALDSTGTLAKMSTKDRVVFAAESYTNTKAPPKPYRAN